MCAVSASLHVALSESVTTPGTVLAAGLHWRLCFFHAAFCEDMRESVHGRCAETPLPCVHLHYVNAIMKMTITLLMLC